MGSAIGLGGCHGPLAVILNLSSADAAGADTGSDEVPEHKQEILACVS
jgi:hypothetical protein